MKPRNFDPSFSLSLIFCHFCYSDLSVFVQFKNQYASGLQISIDDVNASNVFTRISAAPDQEAPLPNKCRGPDVIKVKKALILVV